MRVLIVGGMHGNEPLGLAVVQLLQKEPLQNVEAIYANQEAIAASTRFIQTDLNRSFPGDIKSDSYEARRAAELLELTKEYDVVLDFHNTHCTGNDCGFVGQTANEASYDISWLLGLDRIIIADYDCINKYASNCLSVEISLNSPWNNPDVWYERIMLLSKLDKIAVSRSITTYRFVYRITLDDKKRLDLANRNLRAFQPISKTLAQQMGVQSPAYPIFIGDGYTPYNYGGLLNELNVSQEDM